MSSEFHSVNIQWSSCQMLSIPVLGIYSWPLSNAEVMCWTLYSGKLYITLTLWIFILSLNIHRELVPGHPSSWIPKSVDIEMPHIKWTQWTSEDYYLQVKNSTWIYWKKYMYTLTCAMKTCVVQEWTLIADKS